MSNYAAPRPTPPKPQIPAGLFQQAGLVLAILGLAVPLFFWVIRFATGVAGWLTITYTGAAVVYATLQLALVLTIGMRYSKVNPGAASTLTVALMLATYVAHLLPAFMFSDYGDSPPPAPSWFEQTFGVNVDGVGLFVLALWLILHIATLISAIVALTPRNIATAARAAYRPPVAGYQAPPYRR